MKKSICALFLLIVMFCFFGCGQQAPTVDILQPNAFRILKSTDSSGHIGLSYIFPLNSKQMQEKGLTEDEMMVYRFYLSSYVNALAKVNRDKNVEGANVGYCTYIADVDGIGFSISFDSLETQKEFFGVNDENNQDNSDNKTESSGFFMKKVSLKTNFPISENSAQSLKDVCLLAVNSTCESAQIPAERKAIMQSVFEDSIFIYDFASYSNTLKSENMYEANGINHNIFFKSMDELKNDSMIEFYVLGPNHAVWYVSALIVVCVGMIVTFIVWKIKKSKNKEI